MKRFFAALLCLFVASPGFAQREISVQGLTEIQKADLQAQIARLKNKEENLSTEKVSQWVELGTNLGKGLASTAKELGIAANDFVKTPVGKVTATIIIYKFIGRDIIKIVVGGLFFLIMGTFWIYAFRRTCLLDKIVEESITENGKTTKKRQVIYGDKWRTTTGETVIFFSIMGLVVTAVSNIIMFS